MPLTCEFFYHKCAMNGKGNANAKDQGDHKSQVQALAGMDIRVYVPVMLRSRLPPGK